MNVTHVVVSIHEKRNHPHEYGHFDASVTLTAEPQPGDYYDTLLVELREIARHHVQEECDDWVGEMRKK